MSQERFDSTLRLIQVLFLLVSLVGALGTLVLGWITGEMQVPVLLALLGVNGSGYAFELLRQIRRLPPPPQLPPIEDPPPPPAGSP